MRISDWSSDVCSSDLTGRGAAEREPVGAQSEGGAQLLAGEVDGCGGAHQSHLQHPTAVVAQAVALEHGDRLEAAQLAAAHDGRAVDPRGPAGRQGVVEGKSVSGRVETGGGRII